METSSIAVSSVVKSTKAPKFPSLLTTTQSRVVKPQEVDKAKEQIECRDCPETFSSQRDVIIHAEQKHNHVCPHCPASSKVRYTSRVKVNHHISLKHYGKDPYDGIMRPPPPSIDSPPSPEDRPDSPPKIAPPVSSFLGKNE
jgi:Zn finger protein HypA/HybF involved in hydrogenase expression